MRVPNDLVGCSKTVKWELEQSSLRAGGLALVSKFLIGFFLSISQGSRQATLQYKGWYTAIGDCKMEMPNVPICSNVFHCKIHCSAMLQGAAGVECWDHTGGLREGHNTSVAEPPLSLPPQQCNQCGEVQTLPDCAVCMTSVQFRSLHQLLLLYDSRRRIWCD